MYIPLPLPLLPDGHVCKAALALLTALLCKMRAAARLANICCQPPSLTPLWLLSSLAPKAWALPNPLEAHLARLHESLSPVTVCVKEDNTS